jgi:enoyl-CoA hydratase
MPFNSLLVSDDAAVRTISINRPEKLNALNQATILELHSAFAEAKNDASVRAIILTGSGPKAFVAGADISEFSTLPAATVREFSLAGSKTFRFIETLGKPVIAAINGFCFGGGLELALACSLRFASDGAKLGLPEITLGVLPGFGGTQRLPRLIGRSAALELTLTGAPVSAERALQLGFIGRVLPAADLLPEAQKFAQQLAGNAPHAMRAILDAVILGEDMSLEQGLAFESTLFGLVASTEDMREGTRAFMEKRKASFTGN